MTPDEAARRGVVFFPPSLLYPRMPASLALMADLAAAWIAERLAPERLALLAQLCRDGRAVAVVVTEAGDPWVPFPTLADALARRGLGAVEGLAHARSRLGAVRGWLWTRRPPAWVIVDGDAHADPWRYDVDARRRLVAPSGELDAADVAAALALLRVGPA